MTLQVCVDTEFHHLRVDKHKLQFRRVFLVQKRGYNGIQPDRLSLPRGSCHQEVRHFAEVEHEYLVRDGLAQHNRQVVFRLLELTRRDNGLHRHNLRVFVRHFNAYRSFARHRRNDTYAEGREVKRNVVFQILYLRDSHSRVWDYLVERDGGTDGCTDRSNVDAEALQCVFYSFLVLVLLIHVDLTVARVVFPQ